jgi:UDP-glucuronate decarboxylase
VNLGNPTELTIRELADLVIELSASRSRIDYAPLPEDDPKQRQPDITLARSILDWQPSVEVRDGLRETIAYFRRFLG